MIKLTRLPNPTKAMLDQQFSVSGTVGYLDMQAIETGYELFFGEGSREYDNILKAVNNACEGKPEAELKYTQADLDALYAQVEKEKERADANHKACLQANAEWASAQKEVERLHGALNLEQKAHDKTKADLSEAVEYSDEIAETAARLTTAIDKQIAAEYKDFEDPTRVLTVLERIRNEAQSE